MYVCDEIFLLVRNNVPLLHSLCAVCFVSTGDTSADIIVFSYIL